MGCGIEGLSESNISVMKLLLTDFQVVNIVH